MGIFCMDTGSLVIERGGAAVSDYGDEALCAGWIPSLACHQQHAEKTALPEDLARVDVDAFLRKMYACQR